MRRPKRPFLVLYASRERTPFYEAADRGTAERVAAALSNSGFDPVLLEFFPDQLAEIVCTYGPVPVFNMVYGFVDHSTGLVYSQPDTAALIESAGMRPTGSPSSVQRIVQDKLICGEVLRSHGYRTPRIFSVEALTQLPELVVRKPRFGAHHREVALLDSRHVVEENFDDRFLLQEYIDGPEYTVGLVETRRGITCFPPLLMEFHSASPCVMTGSAKWDIVPIRADDFHLKRISTDIFRKFGMRGYARIDYRVQGGTPVVLDVNSLPNLDPERSYLPLAAAGAGWQYPRLISAIARTVIARSC